MSATFAELFEEFNNASRLCRNKGERLPFLAAKYAALINHCAETPEQKTQLAQEFAKTGLEVLNRIASPNFKNNIIGSVPVLATYFEAMSAPETLKAVPPEAAQDLALAAYALATKGETLDWNVFTGPDNSEKDKYFENYQATLLQLAGAALVCAGDIKAAVLRKEEAQTAAAAREESLGNVTTANPLTASRPLTLKPAGQAA